MEQTSESKLNKRKAGRNRKTEKSNDDKVLSALLTHHEHDEGVVGNCTPATNKDVKRLGGVGYGALSRFLTSKFQDDADPVGRYHRACANSGIGRLLQLWSGELPSRLQQIDERD
jgi:hypothetical protein